MSTSDYPHNQSHDEQSARISDVPSDPACTPLMTPSETPSLPPDACDDECPVVRFPIAIVGMAMRLPGGVGSSEEFWDLLTNKRDGLSEVPGTRYNIDSFYDESKAGAIRTRYGNFLQHDITKFDYEFFNMNKLEVAKMDPQQRMLLEVVWECLESGGQTRACWDGKNIGCYVGVFGEDWLDLQNRDSHINDRYRIVGAGDFALANRVSYEYNLGGPSMTIRTGCSSSLVGLHEACQALYAGECAAAVVAGTNLILTPGMSMSMSQSLVLSTDGLCKSFDAGANGYGRGEAINAVFIKPLHEALRDNDPIRAVVRSTAVNCDGRTANITTPGSISQERLIRRAYARAGISDLSKTGFFECHGTGTAAGDTAETKAVAKVFQGAGVYIGAVKPNVGHSEGASGVTAVIKAALALERKTIPPNIHFQEPNPNIPFQEGKLQVPVEVTPWPPGRDARVSINSFGIGGTNAHAILDSAPCQPCSQLEPTGQTANNPHLMLVSAKAQAALKKQIQKVRGYVRETANDLADVAFTLGLRRDHMPFRAFSVMGDDREDFVFEQARSAPRKTVFVFTGQGAQWPGMGRDLLEQCAEFREQIRQMDMALQGLEQPPNWTIEGELRKPNSDSRVHEAELSQPLCTAVQIGLVNVLRRWGVEPSAVVGHSSGEIAAAYAAGAIPMTTAIAISYLRGQAVKDIPQVGAMAAVGLGPEEVRPKLIPGVTVACENSPKSVTLSGDEASLKTVLERLAAEDENLFHRQLPVGVAYHSHHMDEPAARYERLIGPYMSFNPSMISLYSTMSGAVISEPTALDAAYWSQNLRQPVLFSAAIRQILEHQGATIFLELGPHSALSGPIRQCIAEASGSEDSAYVPTVVRDQAPWACLLRMIGRLHIHGSAVNLAEVIPGGKVVVDLPHYSWQHDERLWDESRVAKGWRLRRAPNHELLGSRSLDSSDLDPSWRGLINLDDSMWLFDHRINNEIVFPCAGFVAMAGEAARQTMPTSTGYSIRNLFIRTPLIFSEGDLVELTTNLTAAKLADNVDSQWYDFTIATYHKGGWRKHCVGQVQPLIEEKQDRQQQYGGAVDPSYARDIASDQWYRELSKRGLNYGPAFRGLQTITASTSGLQAAARIRTTSIPEYTLHPVAIDQALQLLSVAVSQGIASRLERLYLPTAVESIQVKDTTQELLAVHASCTAVGGSITGDVTLMHDGVPVLSMADTLLLGVPRTGSDDAQALLSSHLRWQPDSDLLSAEEILPSVHHSPLPGRILARVASASIVEAYRRTRSCTPASEYLHRYLKWIEGQYQRILDRDSDLVPEMREIPAADLGLCTPEYDRLTEEEANLPETPLIEARLLTERVVHSIEDIIEARVSPLELLLEGDLLDHFYASFSSAYPWAPFLASIGHSNPCLQVLEVGAGTGGLTSEVLNGLTGPNGARLYAHYTFTDISAGFLPRAKHKFRAHTGIEYLTLDISRDPEEQGFTPHAYDMILAGNVVHATQDIQTTLTNIRKLLAPGGYLVLQELANVVPAIELVMGVLPGWWVDNQPARAQKPTISPAEWHDQLLQAGFTGAEAVRYDYEPPYQANAIIVSRPQETPPSSTDSGSEIGLLYHSQITAWGHFLAKQLTSQGHRVQWHTLRDDHPPSSSVAAVISVIDLEGPFFDNLTQEEFALFQRYVSRLSGGKHHLLWLTRSLHMACDDPRFALVLGVARTIRREMGFDFATLEVDHWDHSVDAARHVVQVLQKLQAQEQRPWSHVDHEFALHNGVIHVGRYEWSTLGHHLAAAPPGIGSRTVDVLSAGVLSSLTWALADILPTVLADDEVELDIKCVGLNFRDLMIAMGFLGSPTDMGFEAGAVVRRTGGAVTSLRVGDRVSVFSSGLMGTRKVVAAAHCRLIPADMSFEAAAATGCVFMTVIYSLLSVGNLQAGQSVLIHSACGGVGLAAIQVCQMVGAEIFATVGSREKVDYLVRTHGIAEDHIFSSRSPAFLPQVMNATNGRGVDLVLNSLAGELLHASWKCVASFGKMVELGKRDILGHGKLDLDRFGGNRTFIGVDLARMAAESPEALRLLADQFSQYYAQGQLAPITPINTYAAAEVEQAFRCLQRGKHIGKIVLQMPDDLSAPEPSKLADDCAIFSAQAAYLLVGGLGGLGQHVATWMVSRGARHFVFLSRTASDSPQCASFLDELRSHTGCTAVAVSGDVASMEDVSRAVAAAPTPIAGIMQMSMVLRDQVFENMTYEEWTAALAPKVQGTWNLHRASRDCPLDFFLLFSSVSGICGPRGQANYAAANTFLDSFVRYREARGLPASVIDLGFMGDIGYAAVNNSPTLRLARQGGVQILEQRHLLHTIEIAVLAPMLGAPAQLTVGLGTSKPASETGANPIVPRDARMAAWVNTSFSDESTGGTASDDLGEFLTGLEQDPGQVNDPETQRKITVKLGRLVASYMAFPDDLAEEELAGIPVDSLMSIEIRNWYRRHLGIEVPMADIVGANTVGQLSEMTIQILRTKYGAPGGGGGGGGGPAVVAVQDHHLLTEDLDLGKGLYPMSSGQIPEWTAASEGRVFLVGATGFMGSCFLSYLLQMPAVQTVTCLVRARDAHHAMERIQQSLAKYRLLPQGDLGSKVRVVPGDLRDAALGLAPETFDSVARSCSVVFDLGGHINYAFSYSDHRETNVVGLLNLLHFANSGRLKPVHWCSSVGVLGVGDPTTTTTTTTRRIPEDVRPELTGVMKNHSGHMQSKFAAEQIVWNAIANGFPAAIYRPALIMGHSETGIGQASDLTNRLLANCIHLGSYPALPDCRNQFVPVDYVCSAILKISLSPTNLGHAYNIVQPDQEKTITGAATLDLISQLRPLQRVSRSEWLERFAQRGIERRKVPTALLDEHLSRSGLWSDDANGMAVYENTQFQRAMGPYPEVLKLKPMRELVEIYFPHWVKAGEADEDGP